MKRTIISLGLLVGLCMVLIGCSSVLEEEKKDPIDVLMDYSHTLIGDATAVSHISYILPAGEHVKKISLQTKTVPYELTIDYGIKEDAKITAEDFESDWNENNTKRALLNNAIAYFILVDNLDMVHFTVEKKMPVTMTITREQVTDFVGKDVRIYSDDAEQWKADIEEGILKDDEKVNAFYEEHTLQS